MGWSTGISKEFMTVLHHSCLSMSYSSINSILHALANRSIEQARLISRGPHLLAYDNINISTSIFVEQVPGMPNKVQSGTFAVIYELLNAQLEDMKIQPLMDNLKKSLPLMLSNVRSSNATLTSYAAQMAVNTSQILFKYVDGFDEMKKNPLFQHPPRCPMPNCHKTKSFPLRATTIKKASVDGNLHVHDDVYLTQLAKSPDDLNDNAIPSINDQLTNARIRGVQQLRRMDASTWERRDIFQLSFRTFHLVMNLMWGLLETHRGMMQQVGSLSYFFVILEKTRLGCKHPDYHTLLAALTQIIDGLVLNAWHWECGEIPLKDYSKTATPEEILKRAQDILRKYAVPRSTESLFSPINPKFLLKDLDLRENNLDNEGSSEDEDTEELLN